MPVSFGRKLVGLALGATALAVVPSAASATFSINTAVAGGSVGIDSSVGSFNGTVTIGSIVEGAAIGRIMLRGQASDQPTGILSSMPVWCIDVTSWLGNGTFVEQPLEFVTNPGGAGHVTYSATQLGSALKFLVHATNQNINTTTKSAATQLGLWEILSETSGTMGLLDGTFKVAAWNGDSSILSAAGLANSWMTTAAAASSNSVKGYSLAILDPGCPLGTCNQTQAFLRFNASDVPEPASWMTMILGFGAIGTAVRRRRAVGRAVA